MVLRIQDGGVVVGGVGVVVVELFADSVNGLVEQVASISLGALVGVGVVHASATHTAGAKAAFEDGGVIASVQINVITDLSTERLGSNGGEASISGLFGKEGGGFGQH